MEGSLIDFAAISTDLLSSVGAAITVAAGIGAVILGARISWKFFKGFAKG